MSDAASDSEWEGSGGDQDSEGILGGCLKKMRGAEKAMKQTCKEIAREADDLVERRKLPRWGKDDAPVDAEGVYATVRKLHADHNAKTVRMSILCRLAVQQAAFGDAVAQCLDQVSKMLEEAAAGGSRKRGRPRRSKNEERLHELPWDQAMARLSSKKYGMGWRITCRQVALYGTAFRSVQALNKKNTANDRNAVDVRIPPTQGFLRQHHLQVAHCLCDSPDEMKQANLRKPKDWPKNWQAIQRAVPSHAHNKILRNNQHAHVNAWEKWRSSLQKGVEAYLFGEKKGGGEPGPDARNVATAEGKGAIELWSIFGMLGCGDKHEEEDVAAVQAFIDILCLKEDTLKRGTNLSKVKRQMVALLATGAIKNVGKKGDDLKAMSGADDSCLCGGQKELFEKISRDVSEMPSRWPTMEEPRPGAPHYGPLWWWIMRAMTCADETLVSNLMQEMKYDEGEPVYWIGDVDETVAVWNAQTLQVLDFLLAAQALDVSWTKACSSMDDAHAKGKQPGANSAEWGCIGWLQWHTSGSAEAEFKMKVREAVGQYTNKEEEATAAANAEFTHGTAPIFYELNEDE